MTKIDIISGFLGAGKTTFIKQLLKEALNGEQVVLIENEFGEIGIDGGFLKDAGIEIREMNSGCICCSLVGDFGKSLSEVLSTYHPDRVIIEPSGVGKLSDVIKAVLDVADGENVVLNSATTIVDAAKCKMYMKNFGEFFNNQIEHANAIILSRTDIADTAKVQQDVEMIRQYNQTAAVVTTPCSQLTGEQLLQVMEKKDQFEEELLAQVKDRVHHEHEHHDHGESCGCSGHHHEHHDHEESCGCGGHHHEHEHHEHGESCGCGGHHHEHEHHDHEEGCGCGGEHHHEHGDNCGCGGHDHGHHHAADVFTSWGLETIVPCEREKLEGILDELAYGDQFGEVLRAKGMIPSENPGEWYYFDLVPEEFEIRIGNPDYTGKVCVIGAKLKEEELNRSFGRS